MDRHPTVTVGENLGERRDVRLMGMHSTRRDQPEDVNRSTGLTREAGGFGDNRISCEGSFANGLVDPRQVLHHDTASAQIQMPDLRIPELTFRKTDGRSIGSQ